MAERSVDQQQTAMFLNQGQDMLDKSLPVPEDLSNSYLNQVMNDKPHDILDFLQRPVRVWNGQLLASMTANTQICTLNFPDILLENKMYNEKVQGFVGLRSDVEIRVQINAQKFQQGRLRLQYIPYAKYLTKKAQLLTSSLTTVTSGPGVDIDVCGGSTPETRIAQALFHIPYVSPHLYFNLIRGDGTMGRMNLIVYSPLVSGSAEASSCEVTVWARFVNPKLAFPTGALPYYRVAVTRNHVAQVAGEAKQVNQTGVVSNTLGVVAETLRSASRLPLIGKYLAIPEWISQKGSDIMKLFGFSKPTVTIDTKLRTTNCFSNYNGKDSSHKLALSADNEIDTPSGIAGTGIDEMAISTIASTPAFWSAFNWTTSQTAEDEILWVDPVSPMKFSPIPSSNTYSILPVAYLANVFGLWRGSLTYTFKFVKTGFHSGRVRIFFTPYEGIDALVVGSAPLNTIEKNYQIILDIEESDVVSFDVPYVSTKPWMSVSDSSSSQSPVAIPTGYVVVTVLNELRAVSTVSSSIQVLVEISGGKDMTFALPCAPRLQPARPAGDLTGQPTTEAFVPPPREPREPTILEHVAQVFGNGLQLQRNDAMTGQFPESISAIDTNSNWSPESHCVGEKIVSIRQLLKRNNFVGTTVDNKTSLVTATNAQGVNSYTCMNVFGNKIQDQQHGIDYISYFNMIYAFFRGGMRIKMSSIILGANGNLSNGSTPNGTWYSTPIKNTLLFARMFNAYDQSHGAVINATRRVNNVIGKVGINGITPETANSLMTDASATTLIDQNIEGILEFEVPYYNSTHLSPSMLVTRTTPLNEYDTTNIFPGTSNSDDAYPLPVVLVGMPSTKVFSQLTDGTNSITLNTGYAMTHTIYRSAADDYGLHYFMGTVPVVLGQNLAGTTFQPQAKL